MKGARTFALSAALLGGLVAASGQASAMPNGLSALAQEQTSDVQDVRWVCGPRGCVWRPGLWRGGAFGRVGPRRFWGRATAQQFSF
jgi:hypothetical protein